MDAADWDARYATDDLVWTAEPNRWLVETLADLPPGTALPPMGGELTLHVPPALCRVVPEDDA